MIYGDAVHVAGTTYDDGERIMARFWMIDPRLNRNGWRAPAESIMRCARSFVGKPLIHYFQCFMGRCEAHHATAAPGVPCMRTLEVQEPYRVGTIRNVEITSEAKAHAIVEISDTETREKVRSGTQIFVSPAVCPTPGTVTTDGPDTWGRPTRVLNDWEGMHLAIVDNPAYGPEAGIIDRCAGADCETHFDIATVRTLPGDARPIKGPVDARRAGEVSMVQDMDRSTLTAEELLGRASNI